MRVEKHVGEVGALGVSRYEKPGRHSRRTHRDTSVPRAGAHHA